MADFTITQTDVAITNIAISSISPSDVSKTEDGSITYTYTTNSQRYLFRLRGVTTTNSQYVKLAAKLETVSNSGTFMFDLGSYGNDVAPFQGAITNSLYVDGQVASGATLVKYIADSTAPGGIAPNGVLGVGDLIKFKDATYDKLYRIISVDTSAKTYEVFPSLRQAITDETEILYGSAVKVKVRMTSDNFRFQQRGNIPTLRQFSLNFEEDYTPIS